MSLAGSVRKVTLQSLPSVHHGSSEPLRPRSMARDFCQAPASKLLRRQPLACPPVSAARQCPGAETQHVDHSRKTLMAGSKCDKVNQAVILNSKHISIAF